MKKIGVLFILSIFTVPVFSQGRQSAAETVRHTDLAQKVSRRVATHTVQSTKVPSAKSAPIINRVGRPVARIRLEGNIPVSSPTVERRASFVPARGLNWKTAMDYIFPTGRESHVVHVTTSWKAPENRAIRKEEAPVDWSESPRPLSVETELNKMDIRQSDTFSPSYIDAALNYTISWESVFPGLPELPGMPPVPVVVEKPVVFELPKEPDQAIEIDFIHVFQHSLIPRFMSDSALFLNVNGEVGLYKIVFEGDEVVVAPGVGIRMSW